MFTKTFLIDTAERVIMTFVQTFVAALSFDQLVDMGISGGESALLAAGAAALAALKAAVASYSNGTGASLVKTVV